MKYLFYLIIVVFVASCGPREFEPPEDVKNILELAGENQAEDHPHNHNGSDAALFDHVALLQ